MSAATPRSSRLEGLDGLRAVAATAVLSYHVAEWSKFKFAGSLGSVLWELKGGVAVFFVISGAVLYLPCARAIRDRERLPDWRVYLVERPLQRALRARERRENGVRVSGRTPEIEAGVQSCVDGLNPTGVAVDHLA